MTGYNKFTINRADSVSMYMYKVNKKKWLGLKVRQQRLKMKKKRTRYGITLRLFMNQHATTMHGVQSSALSIFTNNIALGLYCGMRY